MKVKNLEFKNTPQNFSKISNQILKKIEKEKFVEISVLQTKTQLVEKCFHPVSRLFKI